MATNLIQAELSSPFQNAPAPSGGLDLSAGVAAIPGAIQAGKAIEQKSADRAFEDLLAAGKEGMTKMAEALVAEGSLTPEDIAKLDPNSAVFQGQEGQIKWYQGIDAQIKENQSKKQAEERAGLEGEELLETSVEQGLVSPVQQLGAQAGFDRAERVKQFIDTLGGPDAGGDGVSVRPEENDIPTLQSAIDDRRQKIEDANTAGVSGDPDVRPLLKSWESEIRDFQKRINEQGKSTRFFSKEGRLKTEASTKAEERFIKDTTDNRQIATQMGVVNEALVELGLPNGIETFDPEGVDIPGAGFFGDKFKRFVKDPAGVKFVANVERLITQDRHDIYGSALTANESANFKAMIGKSFLGNEMQFLAALRAIKRVNEEGLVGSRRQEAGLEKAQERQRKKKGAKGKQPAATTTETDTSSESEEEQVNREFRELFK